MSRVHLSLLLKGAFSSTSVNGRTFKAARDYYGDQLPEVALSILRDVWRPLEAALNGGDEETVQSAIAHSRVLLEARFDTALGHVSQVGVTRSPEAEDDDDADLFGDDVDFDE